MHHGYIIALREIGSIVDPNKDTRKKTKHNFAKSIASSLRSESKMWNIRKKSLLPWQEYEPA